MIVVARSLASEVIADVVVLATLRVSVVETYAVVVPSGSLLVLLGSSDVFSDEFFYVVSVGIILGRGEEFGDRGRPLA